MPITIMSKAYLLVICLLAASFTGCLADDEIEEQKITPVGTDDGSDDEDYDELVSEIANLTEQIEELNSQIDVLSEDLQSLESYRYNPQENSNITIPLGVSNGTDLMEVSKMGNTIHITAPTYTSTYFVWFEDNAGIEIMMNSMRDAYDRCYTDGNWTTNSTTEACTNPQEPVIYEFNLTREPVNVKVGYPYSVQRGQSFP